MSQGEPEFPVTLQIAKRGDLRWLGHLDFARAVARALRRGGVAVRHSEGFHPRPKLRLPEPLPVGVGSDGERFVVALKEPVGADAVARAVARQLPRGLDLVAAVDGAAPEPRDAVVELRLASERPDRLRELLAEFRAGDAAFAATFDLIEGAPEVRVRLRAGAGARPSVGRFLTVIKPRLAAAGEPLGMVDRTAASMAAGGALQSPALFPPDDEEAPCTP